MLAGRVDVFTLQGPESRCEDEGRTRQALAPGTPGRAGPGMGSRNGRVSCKTVSPGLHWSEGSRDPLRGILFSWGLSGRVSKWS